MLHDMVALLLPRLHRCGGLAWAEGLSLQLMPSTDAMMLLLLKCCCAGRRSANPD